LTGLSLLALALSAYLGWHYLTGGSVIGCSGGSPCDLVLSSRWSTIGSALPVSGLAAGGYLAMLVASQFIGPATEATVRRLAWRAMLVLAGAIVGSAVWFTLLQKWVIRAFCPYCMATHITGLLLAALVIWRAPGQFDDEPATRTRQRVIGRVPAMGLAVVGLALACMLAVSQVVFKPAAAYRAGESKQNVSAIDSHAVPLVGSPEAKYVVTFLFDYNCPHCQQLHLILDESIRRYGGKLAFALCPAPLNTHCNPYIPRDVDEFANSCELAKVGLAVWLANRDAFPAFDRWMFSFESGDRWRPRSLDTAKAKAVELAGQAKFDAALADPWIEQYLQASVRIYGDAGGRAVPKLVFGSRWVTPQPQDADDLVLILQNTLAVPRP
jgi:uncharacterized membrane protein